MRPFEVFSGGLVYFDLDHAGPRLRNVTLDKLEFFSRTADLDGLHLWHRSSPCKIESLGEADPELAAWAGK